MYCLTDILDLVVQRVHLSTEEPTAPWVLELFGVVGGDVPEYFSFGICLRNRSALAVNC